MLSDRPLRSIQNKIVYTSHTFNSPTDINQCYKNYGLYINLNGKGSEKNYFIYLYTCTFYYNNILLINI